MLKFLYFADGDANGGDTGCLPVTLLREIRVDTASDGVQFRFKDVGDGIGNEILIKVNTTTDKAKDVADAVADAIRSSKNPFIVVCDDLSQEYIHPDVTSLQDTTVSIT